MAWRIFRSEVDPHREYAEHLAAASSPYADAWKEFDKLQKRAKQRSGAWWVHFILSNGIPLLGGGAFGAALWGKHKLYVIAALILLIALVLLRAIADRRRFAEWRCPRCHSLWPGTKTEKDSSCNVCGLRLHQMAP